MNWALQVMCAATTSLVPSLHCQFLFACWKKKHVFLLFSFSSMPKKLAVETGNESMLLPLYMCACMHAPHNKHTRALCNTNTSVHDGPSATVM